jgi:hypothetical protein
MSAQVRADEVEHGRAAGSGGTGDAEDDPLARRQLRDTAGDVVGERGVPKRILADLMQGPVGGKLGGGVVRFDWGLAGSAGGWD